MDPREIAEMREAALAARRRGEIMVNERPPRRTEFATPQEREEHLKLMNRRRVQKYRARHSPV